MPTYAQLQAEPWWGREVVTAELDWLGDELCRHTGRPRVAAGTKGDRFHLSGAHRSQEWILNSRYATSRSYTVQAGLTAAQARHVAGFDFTPGGVGSMLTQSQRLMAAVRAGRLEAVRELYCNVDGDRVVDGWDNVRDRAATSDSSHLWHWHLGFDRRRMTDRRLMERVLAIALGDEEEVDEVTAEQNWDHDLTNQRTGQPAPAGSLVAWTHYGVWQIVPAVRELVAGQAALRAQRSGQDVSEVVRAELDRHRGLVLLELAAEHEAAIERAVQRLQQVPAEQVRTVLREELAAVRLVPGQPA